LREAIDQIASGAFSNGDRELFRPFVDSLLERDEYLALADYQAYVACQDKVAAGFSNRYEWTRMSIMNVARSGYFSSDRSIREYAERIWRVKPIPVQME
jgi:starch phosphorylase